ncbi:hypothetical protein QUE96_12945 [Lactococcus lactis]|nr:hypothetical protein [Lactococcus lactis]
MNDKIANVKSIPKLCKIQLKQNIISGINIVIALFVITIIVALLISDSFIIFISNLGKTKPSKRLVKKIPIRKIGK